MEIIVDVDDFSPTKPGLELLKKFKTHYPELKVTCFTPALDEGVLKKKISDKRLSKWVSMINDMDWIEIAPHGLLHVKKEMLCDYDSAIDIIDAAEKSFKKMGLHYKKIWKSPYWQTSNEAYAALRDKDYVVAVDNNQERPKVSGLKMYVWNKCISTPFTKQIEQEVPSGVVKYHGHIAGDFYNDISLCIPQILTMPTDASFITVGEYINKYGYEKNEK